MSITADRCRELFEYRDGELYWRTSGKGRGDISQPAGYIGTLGYRLVGISRKLYKVHRIIFLMTHDYLPEQVDHIDTNKLNNQPSNLRPANASEQQGNIRISKRNTTGYKGVSMDKDKFRAGIKKNGKSFYLGLFDTAEEAHAAYCKAASELHGEFARVA